MKRTITFTGWAIVLLLLYFFSKTSVGYKVIYYSLTLVLILLLLGNYKQIGNVIAPEK